ncbi:MAG: 30S ribosomal protein S5 [Candidatus Kaiserbacteria bacterium]|nr:30S ribosomal protein S5 [Candidatus Kaiserbacteria bacterium]
MTTPMEQETIQEEVVVPETVAEAVVVELPSLADSAPKNDRGSLRGRAPSRGGRTARPPREKGEFDQVTIDARRVARVMAGGRRFNFSLVVVIGDRKGRVGVGLGKGVDTALAIDKATRDAKKHLFTIPRTASGSIPHEVATKYASSTVEIIPSKGRGLVAGSAMRTVLDLAHLRSFVLNSF